MSPRLVLTILAASLGLACSASRENAGADSAAALPAKADVGFRAPEYDAVTLKGDSVSLADYTGKVVLLNVWATWCGPCRKEIPELRELHSRYGRDGLTVVGVTVDAEGSEPQIAEFVREFQMDYPLWHDPAERVSAQFAIMGLPATFLIDRRGVIRWKTTGPLVAGDTALTAAIRAAVDAR
jgi:peroxiredoxin